MTDVTILPYSPDLAIHFRRINEEWIEEMFELEEIDRVVTNDPQAHVIDKGGDILFAALPDLGIVGTGALKPWENGMLELTKMGVLSSARGRKAGEALLSALIRRGEDMAPGKLFLLTNARCEAAIHLYEKAGFVHDEDILKNLSGAYCRCNVGMRYRGI